MTAPSLRVPMDADAAISLYRETVADVGRCEREAYAMDAVRETLRRVGREVDAGKAERQRPHVNCEKRPPHSPIRVLLTERPCTGPCEGGVVLVTPKSPATKVCPDCQRAATYERRRVASATYRARLRERRVARFEHGARP